MADQPTPPPRKLYIETVGCQMNLLDSELVVAKLRQRRLRADRRHQPGRRDPLQHLLGAAARRGQDLQRPGPDQAAQGAQARADDRRAGLHGAEGPGRDLPPRAARRHRRRPGPACQGAGIAREGPGENAHQIAVSRAATTARSSRSRRASRIRRRSRAGDAAQPVPGVRPGHDGLRQVLHLLHRPLGPRARAEPAARR